MATREEERGMGLRGEIRDEDLVAAMEYLDQEPSCPRCHLYDSSFLTEHDQMELLKHALPSERRWRGLCLGCLQELIMVPDSTQKYGSPT